MVIGVLAVLPAFSRFTTISRTPSSRLNLKLLHTALMIYETRHGVLPADPRGEAHALYLLEDIAEGDASFFADPLVDIRGVSRPEFDDGRRMVVNSHFEYLNDPRPGGDDVVVLAEVPGLNAKRRHYATLGGTVSSIDAQVDPLADSPLLGLRVRLVNGKFVPLPRDAAEATRPRGP